MKLENQVCTIEQAIQLRKLGITQNNEYFWQDYELIEGGTIQDVCHCSQLEEPGGHCGYSIYSAFTVAELGVMLPKEIEHHHNEHSSYYVHFGHDGIENKPLCYYEDNDLFYPFEILQSASGDTEAEARAAMLIFLLENNHTTPEEVNSRLNTDQNTTGDDSSNTDSTQTITHYMKKEIPLLFSSEMVSAILDGRKVMTRRVVKPQPEAPRAIYNDSECTAIMGTKEHHAEGLLRFVWRTERYTKLFTDGTPFSHKCPYGKPGDILFVRENWRMKMWDFEDSEVTIQFADGEEVNFFTPEDDDNVGYEWMVKQFEKLVDKEIISPIADDEEIMEFTGKKHPLSPSIHLPKWCSRIWLEVTEVRVERLQDITPKDAIAEGILFYQEENQRPRYKDYLADASGYGHPAHDYPTVGVPETSFATLWQSINGPESWNANPWVWVVKFRVLSTTGKPEIN